MVNLYEANVGDYVLFRNKGAAKITYISTDQEDEDWNEYTHTLKFDIEGMESLEQSYTASGNFYADDERTMQDIMHVIPAYIYESRIKQQEPEDEIPF